MIKQTFPSKRPKSMVAHAVQSHDSPLMKEARRRNITPTEFERRQEIVRLLYNKVKVREHCYYNPKHEERRKMYGPCLIKQVFKSYWEFPVSEPWPDDDHPFIITFMSPQKPTQLMLCTEEYFTPIPVKPESANDDDGSSKKT
jgi:hypothetical protein